MELIGDCYFAVAGGPNPCADAADRCAQLGLAMLDAVRAAASRENVDLQVFGVGVGRRGGGGGGGGGG